MCRRLGRPVVTWWIRHHVLSSPMGGMRKDRNMTKEEIALQLVLKMIAKDGMPLIHAGAVADAYMLILSRIQSASDQSK